MTKLRDGYFRQINSKVGDDNYLLKARGGYIGLHTGRNNEANKVVRTDENGYIQAGWINTTSGSMDGSTPARIYASYDGYIRYMTPSYFFSVFENSTNNQVSITIGGQNRKLSVNADLLDGYNYDAFAWKNHDHNRILPTRHDSGHPAPNATYGLTFQFSYFDSNWWNVLNMRSYSDNNYSSTQLLTKANNPGSDTYSGDSMYWRQGRNGTWNTIKCLLDSSNYTSYAASASHTHSYLEGTYNDVQTQPLDYGLYYTAHVNYNTIGTPATNDNSNGIISLNRHPGNYWSQIGLGSDGRIKYRSYSATAISSDPSRAWNTLAYTSEIPTWDTLNGKPDTFPPSSHNHDDRYYTETEANNRFVNVTGDSMSGVLSIQTQAKTKSSPTDQQLVINGPNYNSSDSTNLQYCPGIGFHLPGRTWASLIWNGYFTGVNSNYSGYVGFYGSGFTKEGSSNSYVLLGGGGHKAVSDFSTSSHSHAAVDYLYPHYNSGDKPNPQEYFNEHIGVKVAMTRYANIGGSTAWHDTLWINGYTGSDVPYVTSLTFRRDGTPRFFVHSQSNRATSYGTYYEVITAYNIGSQHVSYASSAGSVAWGNVTGKPFNWSGQSGQPTWLWGSNDGTNYYVWNPSNFNVNYAASAGDADSVDGQHFNWNNNKNDHTYLWAASSNGQAYLVHRASISVNYANTAERARYLSGHSSSPDNSHPGHGARVFYSWNTGQAGNSSSGYSNGITIGSHPSDTAYGFQIVQNMWDDRTYTRRYNGGWQEWKTLAWTSDIPTVGNGTVTIYQNGTTKGTFTLNQSGDATINLTDYNYYPSRKFTSGLQISTGVGNTSTAAECALYVPNATTSQSGVVSTADQSFKGNKTFEKINDITPNYLLFYAGRVYKNSGSSSSYSVAMSGFSMTCTRIRNGAYKVRITNNNNRSCYIHPMLSPIFPDKGEGSCYEHGFVYFSNGDNYQFPYLVAARSYKTFTIICGYMHTQKNWSTSDFTKSEDYGGFICEIFATWYGT